MSTSTAEQAVGAYLRALQDPASVRDEARIASLRDALGRADDPLERLRLRSELQRARRMDLTALEDAFAEHAKAWALENRISPEAFSAEGVPPRVLRAAGFPPARRARRAGTGRVSRDHVRKMVPRREFTIGELAERSGASLGTIRTVVRDMLERGELEAVGVRHDGVPGRAPTVYRAA